MKLRMRGKVWDFVRGPCGPLKDGDCQAPDIPNKKITVIKKLKGERELEVIIHELTHAGLWDLDEYVIQEFSKDMARALRRIGYRKNDEKGSARAGS